MVAESKFFDILKVLVRHGVEFIVVGGVASILEGAPVSTFDLDVMVRPTPEDRDRLLSALRQLNARYLDPAGRHLLPDATKLATLRLHRFLTDSGPLDVLETIGAGLTYSDVVGDSHLYDVEGDPVRVLGLATIIRSKEEANRDKDRATLPVLRRTLALKAEEQK